MTSIRLNELTKEVTKALQQYTDEVEKGIEEAGTKVAKNTVKNLKKTSPKETGSYAKGWRVAKVKGKRIIHNKTDYQLTHLLENGHAKANGGRVAARVHIRPAEQKAIEEYVEEVEKVVRG